MAKLIFAEKVRAGLRHAVACPNVTGRTKQRIAQSKRARAGSPAIVDLPYVARTCILRADVVLSFTLVTFVLFCFIFVFLISLRPRPFVQSFFVLRYACAPLAACSYVTTVCVLLSFCFFIIFRFFGDAVFSEFYHASTVLFNHMTGIQTPTTDKIVFFNTYGSSPQL